MSHYLPHVKVETELIDHAATEVGEAWNDPKSAAMRTLPLGMVGSGERNLASIDRLTRLWASPMRGETR